MSSKGFRVTVEDLDTGHKESRIVAPGDYILIPFAPCRLHYTEKSSNGTVTLTLKDHRPQQLDDAR